MREKLMQDLLIQFPSEVMDEEGLKFSDREVQTGSNRLDIILIDRRGRHVLVEVQSGSLDTKHIDRHIDYSEGYRRNNPDVDIRLIFVANHIDIDKKTFLERRGYEYREVSEYKLSEIAKNHGLVEQPIILGINVPDHQPAPSHAPTKIGVKLARVAPSAADQIYISFWDRLNKLSLQRESHLKFRINNSQYQWYRDIDIGYPGASICLTVHKNPPEVTCELQIPKSPELYDWLLIRKAELIPRLNCQPQWIAKPGQIMRRIRTSRGANILEDQTGDHTLTGCFRQRNVFSRFSSTFSASEIKSGRVIGAKAKQ